MIKKYSFVDFIRLKGNLDFYCDKNLKIDYTQVLFGTTVVYVETKVKGLLQSFVERRLGHLSLQDINKILFIEEINKCYIPIYTLKGNDAYKDLFYLYGDGEITFDD